MNDWLAKMTVWERWLHLLHLLFFVGFTTAIAQILQLDIFFAAVCGSGVTYVVFAMAQLCYAVRWRVSGVMVSDKRLKKESDMAFAAFVMIVMATLFVFFTDRNWWPTFPYIILIISGIYFSIQLITAVAFVCVSALMLMRAAFERE